MPLKPGTMAGAYVLKRELASGGAGPSTRPSTEARPARRRQGAAPQSRLVSGDGRALRARGARGQPDPAPQHRRHLRVRRLPDGRQYFVMELLEGARPRTLLERAGRFPPSEALRDPRAGLLARWRPRTRRASSTAISSPSNIFIANDGRPARSPSCSTSASPSCMRRGGRGRAHRRGTGWARRTHVARADPRRHRRPAHRHLRAGRGPLPPADRAVSVPGRDDDRHRAHAPGGAAAAPEPGRPGAAALDAVVLRCMEKTPERRYHARRRSSRRSATWADEESAEPEVTRTWWPSSSRSGSRTAPMRRATRCWTIRRPSSMRPSRASGRPG